jgi:hypothetical protein
MADQQRPLSISCAELSLLLAQQATRDIHCETTVTGSLAFFSPLSNVDGSHIEIDVMQLESGAIRVSDLGESLRFLASFGMEFRDSAMRLEQADLISKRMGVSFNDGRVSMESSLENLPTALWNVIEATRFITDLVYTARPREESEFRDRVVSILKSTGQRLDKGVEFKGRSSRVYNIDYRLHGDVPTIWVETVSGGQSSTFEGKLDRAYVAWSDAAPGNRLATVFDDTSPLLQEAHVKLMRDVSKVFLLTEVGENPSAILAA